MPCRHHGVLCSGLYAGSAGRTAVQTAGFYEDLRHGSVFASGRDPRSGADGLLDSGQNPIRGEKSHQPDPDPDLRSDSAFRPEMEVVGPRRGTLVLLAVTCDSRHSQLGSEFMPPLWEGDLLYMPTTLPGISVTKAREILQQTDKIIKRISRSASCLRQDRSSGNRHRSGPADR